ncbi:TetR/AcrR family transcriptional regulator [Rhodococcus sp. NPDC059234]|uniref:TetR/AcrR family transcriptional regulator n=1 Tax=Rhodococcus sp. NPDC059234 TaxID=3346781 RepID=UPI00367121ED
MSDKRERVLDAAIDQLGTRGLRGLTHRGVDAAAGMPEGSTSNYFRTRAALIEALILRLVECDREDWRLLGAQPVPATVRDLADGLTGYVFVATGANRVRTAARIALFAEAVSVPGLAEPLAAARADLVEWGARMLAALGSAEPATGCRILVDYLDGVIFHQLSTPAAEFDPGPGIVTVLGALVPGGGATPVPG